MQSTESAATPSFSERVGMAFKLIFNAGFARDVATGLKGLATKQTSAPTPSMAKTAPGPDREYRSGLFVLSSLQREGRLIDFLQQDVASFSDEEVGAAARVVHAGCAKVLKQYFDIEPASRSAEGESMTVPQGFDAQRIRLTGNVTGQPPFKGTLKHHGWVAKEIRLPAVPESLDAKVLAPAEVELP
jgi:hypothetical protein